MPRRCGWCLCPVVAGRCTHCGRRDTGREGSIPEPLAARLAARRRQLSAAGRRARHERQVVVRSRRRAPQGRRWLPWLASAGLLAFAACYAFAGGWFASAVPPSWPVGCDRCDAAGLLRRAVPDAALAATPAARPAARAK